MQHEFYDHLFSSLFFHQQLKESCGLIYSVVPQRISSHWSMTSLISTEQSISSCQTYHRSSLSNSILLFKANRSFKYKNTTLIGSVNILSIHCHTEGCPLHDRAKPLTESTFPWNQTCPIFRKNGFSGRHPVLNK